jgi:hypothetical protein
MNAKTLSFATCFCAIVSSAFSAPTLTAVPGGVQAGNWVWKIDITPDLSLVPDSSGTPMAVELGFRLTGAQLLSATITDPIAWDTFNPGKKIFGWEPNDPFTNSSNSFGLQTNLATGEIFAAIGSMNFITPGPTHFLTVMASGPSAGPPSFSSTIQWLGVYGVGSNKGRISQITGGTSGGPYTAGNFDTFAGSATQSVPEPATTILLGLAVFAVPMRRFRRRSVLR